MNYYQLKLKFPNIDVNGFIEMVLHLEKMISWTMTAELKRFTFKWFWSLIVNEEFSVCPGMGWEMDAIDFDLGT